MAQIKRGIDIKQKSAAQMDADCRKAYSEFDRDCKLFGRDVALFNAGFTVGWGDAAESATKGRHALERLGEVIKTWTPAMKQAWNRAHAHLRAAATD